MVVQPDRPSQGRYRRCVVFFDYKAMSKPYGTFQIPQRLLGPTTFTYDRLKAVLGSLLREYDEAGSRSNKYCVHEEQEVYRVQTSALVNTFLVSHGKMLIPHKMQDLISLRLLHRTTPLERIENSVYKCGISFDQANALARKLKIPLKELLWESI